MIPSHQQSLYYASGAEVFTNAVSYNNRGFYETMYQGYDNGFSYFSTCPWKKTAFGTPKKNEYKDCTVTGDPINYYYDPRCRPWY